MAITCSNRELLVKFVRETYVRKFEEGHPTAGQHQFRFADGLIMNIYETGTVNFQGKSHENYTASDIIKYIEVINRNF